MQKYFEKIIERLEELQNYACFPTEFVSVEQEPVYKYFRNELTKILDEIQEESKDYNESVKRDLISRSKAIEDLKEQMKTATNPFFAMFCDHCILFLEKQPTSYNDGWIPCSNMPKPGKRYFVTAKWKVDDYEKLSVYDAVYGSDGFWHTYDYKITLYEVIAWQPLPAPYQPKGEEQ